MRKLVQVGESYGELTVIRRAGASVDGYTLFECRCSCEQTSIVQGRSLVSGNTKSCGHLRGRSAEETLAKKHPSEYRAWVDMIQFCENPNNKAFKNIGGKGIQVSQRWRAGFEFFLKDVGPKPENTVGRTWMLSRDNKNKNYGPDNAGWTTLEQIRNPTKYRYRRKQA